MPRPQREPDRRRGGADDRSGRGRSGGRPGTGRPATGRAAGGRQRDERDPSRPSWEPREKPSRWQRNVDRDEQRGYGDRSDRGGRDDRGRGGRDDRDAGGRGAGRGGERHGHAAPRGDREARRAAVERRAAGRDPIRDRARDRAQQPRGPEAGTSYRDLKSGKGGARRDDRGDQRQRPVGRSVGGDRDRLDDRARADDRSRRDDRTAQHRAREDRSRDQAAPRIDRARPDGRVDSTYYPSRAAQPGASDDVVHDRLAATAVSQAVEGIGFDDLGLGAGIVGALGGLGATAPFPIQAAAIPEAIAGRDVLGRGRTGSGKTIAFVAPIVEHLLRTRPDGGRTVGRPPRALVLAPTRELAMQIDQVTQSIGKAVGIFTTTIVGGVRQGPQEKALERGVDILIGTPGRIEDLVEQGILNLGRVEIAVLDEADHMCELGFLEPVQRLLRRTRPDSQKLLFSATLDQEVSALAKEFLRDPAVLEVEGEDQASGTIDHHVLVVDRYDKDAVLEQLALAEGPVVVFARTRVYAERLAQQMVEAGILAASLHGDLTQARRQRNLDMLQKGSIDVLVATDVAARGIHIDSVGLVVQADPPDEHKTYMHRSGRTGRAGRRGTVVTVIARSRRDRMQQLLERAEIEAPMVPVGPADDVLSIVGVLPRR
ncbi:DEAD/DEAH box helicase [Agrococcus jejuensis]|uniref:DEAD/DEAH box helicase n=1 Tax=Agrococcus jejuensis TaxID=399736 RepID=UPI0021B6C02D|nr:DEAD/DEAH box helicase [Agrococcus jejuensis]